MPLGLWQLNRLLGDCLTNSSEDFSKILIVVELRISVSNYSIEGYGLLNYTGGKPENFAQ